MRKFLSYKGRSCWKSYALYTNIYNTRSIVVTKSMLGKEVKVHFGNNIKKFKISVRHIGYKLGQFIFTKKMGSSIHKNKKDKKQQGSNKKGQKVQTKKK